MLRCTDWFNGSDSCGMHTSVQQLRLFLLSTFSASIYRVPFISFPFFRFDRAYIESVESPTTVNIFYVDYGTREVVDVKHLRLLKRKYIRLPFQVSTN